MICRELVERYNAKKKRDAKAEKVQAKLEALWRKNHAKPESSKGSKKPAPKKPKASDNCGTGAGGFKPGNTCAAGSSRSPKAAKPTAKAKAKPAAAKDAPQPAPPLAPSGSPSPRAVAGLKAVAAKVKDPEAARVKDAIGVKKGKDSELFDMIMSSPPSPPPPTPREQFAANGLATDRREAAEERARKVVGTPGYRIQAYVKLGPTAPPEVREGVTTGKIYRSPYGDVAEIRGDDGKPYRALLGGHLRFVAVLGHDPSLDEDYKKISTSYQHAITRAEARYRSALAGDLDTEEGAAKAAVKQAEETKSKHPHILKFKLPPISPVGRAKAAAAVRALQAAEAANRQIQTGEHQVSEEGLRLHERAVRRAKEEHEMAMRALAAKVTDK